MDKQNEIEEMAATIALYAPINCNPKKIATDLINAGYGDVEQALIKYADKLASHIAGHSNYHGDNILSAIYVLAEGRDIKDVQPLNLEKIRKQAVIEFAEKLKKRLAQKEVNLYNGKSQVIQIDMQATVIIDKLVKEVCGE